MPSRYVCLLTVGGLVASFACGPPADPTDAGGSSSADAAAVPMAQRPFAGAWSLAGIERRNADGELQTVPVEGHLAYLIYDAAGSVGVTIPGTDQIPPAEDGLTAGEALAQFGSDAPYFGRFTVNEAEAVVTHQVVGSFDPGDAGAEYDFSYTLASNQLTLQPPPQEDGSTTMLTWMREPDLPASEVSETHRQLFGAYRIESATRHTTDGYAVEVEPYEDGYLLYAPSGHMSLHLLRSGPASNTGEPLAADETMLLPANYVGLFSVREMAGCITCPGPRDQGYLLHHPLPSGGPGNGETELRRYYELTDTHLTLRPPVHMDNEGREVVTALQWARLHAP